MLTVELLQSTASRAMHTLSDRELVGKPVSSSSQWHSENWDIDNTAYGANAEFGRIRWRIELSNGSFLTDPEHSALLDWLRRVCWGLMAAPGDGANSLSPETMGRLSTGLVRVVPWMVDNAIRWPHELTPEMLERFLADMPQRLAIVGGAEFEDDETTVSSATAWQAIQTIYYIWRQRRTLQAAGIRPMPTAPWPDAKGANTLAQRMSDQIRGWIQPLPDEIAVPLLNRVTWFLGDPAQDVIRLRDLCDEAYSRGASNYRSGPGTTSSSRVVRQRLAANRFTFCTVDGESSPWHESLSEKGTGKLSAGAVLRVKQLVVDLQAACCFALQAFTGMRVSELCGLRAGIDSKTGLPCDVELRLCPSGLNEEFILTSELSKGQRYPREMPWLLGSRRVGDTDLPIAVSAIILLDDLIRPYRALLQSDRLLVSLTSPSGLPKTSDGVMRMTGGRILRMYRDYLSEWIDLSGLPDESRHATSSNDLILWREKRGSSITTHQLRKTFALFVLSVHPV